MTWLWFHNIWSIQNSLLIWKRENRINVLCYIEETQQNRQTTENQISQHFHKQHQYYEYLENLIDQSFCWIRTLRSVIRGLLGKYNYYKEFANILLLKLLKKSSIWWSFLCWRENSIDKYTNVVTYLTSISSHQNHL